MRVAIARAQLQDVLMDRSAVALGHSLFTQSVE
jgi:hypothetical protein